MAPLLLSVENLRLEIPVAGGVLHAVRGVDLALRPVETLGIVGESGSGKSLTAMSIMGLHPAGSTRTADCLMLDGHDLRTYSEGSMARQIRGVKAGMIFQEPMTSLNPVRTVGAQLSEVMTVHGLGDRAEASERAVALLERVGIAGARRRMGQYPHQFSGGQRQRVMIAMALMAQPKLLIADEPTTALDVTVQAEILRLLAELREELGMGLILISHNLGLVSRVADHVAVMYAGEVVEHSPAGVLFRAPRHPYTRGLLSAIPDGGMAGSRLGAILGVVPSLVGAMRGCAFAARCDMALETCASLTPPVKHPDKMSMYRCVHDDLAAAGPVTPNLAADKSHRVSQGVVLRATGLERRYHVGRGIFAKPVVLRAVAGVNLSVQQGEVLAIVGESGCGKSTLGRLLLGLEPADAGDVVLLGRPIGAIGGRERARLIQPVFQDPRGSLNPRRSVSAIIRRPLDVHRIGTPDERTKRVRDVMDEVGLPSRVFHSYPGQMSGGQRQRVAIARALVMNPSILLCDEPTSALDVSVQAQILNLLLDLRDRMGLTFILITHDLSVVEHMADRVAVMYLGEIVEEGPAEAIFRDAENPYTRALIQSALPLAAGSGVPSARIRPGFPNPLERPEGCTFSPRCPDVLPVCGHVVPARHQRTRGQGFAAYHLRANIGVAEAGAADRGVSAPS